MNTYYCPACGEKLDQWSGGVMECPDCGNMFGKEVLEETADWLVEPK